MVVHQKVAELFDLQVDGDTHELYINLCDEQYYIEPNHGPQLLLAEVLDKYALLDDTERLKVHAVIQELHYSLEAQTRCEAFGRENHVLGNGSLGSVYM